MGDESARRLTESGKNNSELKKRKTRPTKNAVGKTDTRRAAVCGLRTMYRASFSCSFTTTCSKRLHKLALGYENLNNIGLAVAAILVWRVFREGELYCSPRHERAEVARASLVGKGG